MQKVHTHARLHITPSAGGRASSDPSLYAFKNPSKTVVFPEALNTTSTSFPARLFAQAEGCWNKRREIHAGQNDEAKERVAGVYGRKRTLNTSEIGKYTPRTVHCLFAINHGQRS